MVPKSRSRCCADCRRRQVKVTDQAGQVIEDTVYYHRQVYAQLHGPHLSTILDLEPIRPGEDEAAAALRLLGRMRRLYGPRFFDVMKWPEPAGNPKYGPWCGIAGFELYGLPSLKAWSKLSSILEGRRIALPLCGREESPNTKGRDAA